MTLVDQKSCPERDAQGIKARDETSSASQLSDCVGDDLIEEWLVIQMPREIDDAKPRGFVDFRAATLAS